jgi:hypothetical protein
VPLRTASMMAHHDAPMRKYAGTARSLSRLLWQAGQMPPSHSRRGLAERHNERQPMSLEGRSIAILIAPRGTEEPEFVQPKHAVFCVKLVEQIAEGRHVNARGEAARC